MKKFFYLATALLVLAGAVSCKKNSDVQGQDLQATGKMKTVTISAGQGTAKTSVKNGNLTWSAGDQLSVIPQSGTGFSVATLDIKSGVGSASGTFTGNIDEGILDDTPLYAYCGNGWEYASGSFTITMPDTQEYVENGLAEGAFPSIGTGSVGGGVSLKNPLSVLKLNVKGTGTVQSISVASVANNLSGKFSVSINGDDITVTTVEGAKTQTMSGLNVSLSSTTAKSFFFIVPPFKFVNNDLTVTVTTESGSFSNILEFTQPSSGVAVARDIYKIKEECGNRRQVLGSISVNCGSVSQTYTTCQIGSQVWMTENYRCLTYSNSASATIDANLKGTTLTNSSSVKIQPYYVTTSVGGGYLYNWAAAVGLENGSSQSSAFSGHRQGICPDGWHIPTADEWETLRQFVADAPYVYQTNNAGKILKKDDSKWESHTGIVNLDCYGFAALPTGYFTDKGYMYLGQYGSMWTSNAKDGGNAYSRYVGYMEDGLLDDTNDKKFAQAVRCLRDTPAPME